MEQVIQNYRKIVALIQNKLNDADFQNIAYLNGINEEIKTLKGSVDLNALIEVAILNAENHLNYIENLEKSRSLGRTTEIREKRQQETLLALKLLSNENIREKYHIFFFAIGGFDGRRYNKRFKAT